MVEGVIEVQLPQVRNARGRFKSTFIAAYLKRTETIDKLILNIAVKGLSVRDIEQTMLICFPAKGYDSWLVFLHDLTERGPNEPTMIISDGSPGGIKA